MAGRRTQLPTYKFSGVKKMQEWEDFHKILSYFCTPEGALIWDF